MAPAPTEPQGSLPFHIIRNRSFNHLLKIADKAARVSAVCAAAALAIGTSVYLVTIASTRHGSAQIGVIVLVAGVLLCAFIILSYILAHIIRRFVAKRTFTSYTGRRTRYLVFRCN